MLKSWDICRIFGSSALSRIGRLNSHDINLKNKFGEFYIPGIHIHPDYVDESVDEIGFILIPYN